MGYVPVPSGEVDLLNLSHNKVPVEVKSVQDDVDSLSVHGERE